MNHVAKFQLGARNCLRAASIDILNNFNSFMSYDFWSQMFMHGSKDIKALHEHLTLSPSDID